MGGGGGGGGGEGRGQPRMYILRVCVGQEEAIGSEGHIKIYVAHVPGGQMPVAKPLQPAIAPST